MTPEESKRIHLDWWGECRTCKWWSASERPNLGLFPCLNECSLLHNQQTSSSGHCPEWDSFDVEIALSVMEDEA